jgi:hypothetical protein
MFITLFSGGSQHAVPFTSQNYFLEPNPQHMLGFFVHPKCSYVVSKLASITLFFSNRGKQLLSIFNCVLIAKVS